MKKIIYKITSFILKLVIPFIKFKDLNKPLKEAQKDIEKIYEKKEIFDKGNLKLNQDNTLDLSLIIPVYNSENYLKECLDSILVNKTNYKFEIIAVNDGSTDRSLQILKEYESKYSNFVVIDKKNGGISSARNKGIEVAKGKYIGFIDNDDYVSNDYIQKLLDRAYKSNADIVKCNHINFEGESGKELSVVRHEDCSIKGDILEKILEFKGYIWGGIIKKELWQKVRFPIGYWYEDMITRIIIYRLSKQFEYLDESLYFYRIHKTNASKIIWKKGNVKNLDQYFLLEELLKLSNELNLKNDSTLYKIILFELRYYVMD